MMWRAGVARADAERAVAQAVGGEATCLRIAGETLEPRVRLRVLAAGKAAVPMARALVARAGRNVVEGLVVSRPGHGRPVPGLAFREAGHPVPDTRSAAAGRDALALASRAGPGEVLVVLLSGGASALLSAPLPGLEVDDVARTTDALLRAGAEIEALNAVRKHLLAVTGGRLARAARTDRIRVLAVSDVPGDDPAVLASGPCAADPSGYADALDAVVRLGVEGALPPRVRAHLRAGVAGEREESVKPGDPLLARVAMHVLARNADAVEGAARAAAARGLPVHVLRGELRGEARLAGRRLAALGRAAGRGAPVPPRLLLAGGETAVTVRGPGRGGRNQELALAAALELAGLDEVALLAAGTDGSDGPTDAAGAHADGGTVARGAARGADARGALEANDSHGFFAREGGLLVTGPTGTNVRDLVLLCVGRPAPDG